jgi:hypothetical protein
MRNCLKLHVLCQGSIEAAFPEMIARRLFFDVFRGHPDWICVVMMVDPSVVGVMKEHRSV